MAGKKMGRLEADSGREYLGDWKDVLGHGGVGRVLAGVAAEGGRPVAIKEYKTEPDATVDRIKPSIETHKNLDHPRLVPLFDWGTRDSGEPFVVMPRYEGSLAHRLAAGPLDEGTAARYLYDVLLGLVALHAAGHVHRDIKPSNLLIGESDRISIADFDLVKDVADPNPRTQYSAGVGTFAYRPKECWDEARAADDRADMWGLGVTLYEMLSGTRPFQGKVEDDTLFRAIREADFTPLGERAPEMAFWDQLLTWLLKKNSVLRPRARDLFEGPYRAYLRVALDACWSEDRPEQAHDLCCSTPLEEEWWIERTLAAAACGREDRGVLTAPTDRSSEPLLDAIVAARAIADQAPHLAAPLRGIVLRSCREPSRIPYDDVAFVSANEQRSELKLPDVNPAPIPLPTVRQDQLSEYALRYPSGRELERVRRVLRWPPDCTYACRERAEKLVFDPFGGLWLIQGHRPQRIALSGARAGSIDRYKPSKSINAVVVGTNPPRVAVLGDREMYYSTDGVVWSKPLTSFTADHDAVWLDERRLVAFDASQQILFVYDVAKGTAKPIAAAAAKVRGARFAGRLSAGRVAIRTSKSKVLVMKEGKLTKGYRLSERYENTCEPEFVAHSPIRAIQDKDRILTRSAILDGQGKTLRTFLHDPARVVEVAVSRDGRIAAFLESDRVRTVSLEDADLPFRNLPLHGLPDTWKALCVALNGDGTLLAVSGGGLGSSTGETRVYQLQPFD